MKNRKLKEKCILNVKERYINNFVLILSIRNKLKKQVKDCKENSLTGLIFHHMLLPFTIGRNLYIDLYLKITTADKKNEKKNCILNVKESDINNFVLLFITQKQAKNLQRKSNFPSKGFFLSYKVFLASQGFQRRCT